MGAKLNLLGQQKSIPYDRLKMSTRIGSAITCVEDLGQVVFQSLMVLVIHLDTFDVSIFCLKPGSTRTPFGRLPYNSLD